MDEMNMKDFADLSPKEYFDKIKEKKNTVTSEKLSKIYENCLELANKYYKTGQVRALRKILFCLDSLEREQPSFIATISISILILSPKKEQTTESGQ